VFRGVEVLHHHDIRIRVFLGVQASWIELGNLDFLIIPYKVYIGPMDYFVQNFLPLRMKMRRQLGDVISFPPMS